MSKNRTPISQEFALAHGLSIEPLPEYAQRNFLTQRAVLERIKSQKTYAFKQGKKWWIVTKNGEDLRMIVV